MRLSNDCNETFRDSLSPTGPRTFGRQPGTNHDEGAQHLVSELVLPINDYSFFPLMKIRIGDVPGRPTGQTCEEE